MHNNSHNKNLHNISSLDNILWHDKNGNTVSCTEKIKVMQQNIDEFMQLATDLYEDGILMGINSIEIKQYLLKKIGRAHV